MLLAVWCTWSLVINAQTSPLPQPKPRLVVGIVVDQMRYDFLYRFSKKYSKGGFQRLLEDGFSFENCRYSYAPTYTGPGHASVFTGTTPAVHGIVGNNWFDKKTGKGMYCTQDDTARGLGTSSAEGKMSPRNLRTTTLGDQIRLSDNFRGKSFGISIKDRGAILPAGGGANAAFWFAAPTGHFVSSTWYRELGGKLPDWLQKFNAENRAQKWVKDSVWKPLLPISEYTESHADLAPWEESFPGHSQPVFPYVLSKAFQGRDYEIIRKTPFGNNLTALAAQALIKGESLGKDEWTDFLSVSFSCTDVVGHAHGPYAIETQDTYLRLDRDIERFLDFLDTEVGKGGYLVFLTADHGILDVPAFLQNHHLPGGLFDEKKVKDSLRQFSATRFGSANLVEHIENLQVYLNETECQKLRLSRSEVLQEWSRFLETKGFVHRAFPWDGTPPFPKPPHLETYEAGYFPQRSGDVQMILEPGIMDKEGAKGTTHGAPWTYDTHVPFLVYGWKIKPGSQSEVMHIEDIAPTLSTLLHIQEPHGTTGKPQTIQLKP